MTSFPVLCFFFLQDALAARCCSNINNQRSNLKFRMVVAILRIYFNIVGKIS